MISIFTIQRRRLSYINIIKDVLLKPSYNNKIQVEIKPQDYKSSSTLIRHEKQDTLEAIVYVIGLVIHNEV
jgi:hypothetical protein